MRTALLERAAPSAARVVHTAPVRTLHPGDVVVAQRGERLATLLGSCVAIVLTDPRRTVAAMCHVVSAWQATEERRQSTAFGDTAMQYMADGLRAQGIEPRLCEAYLYGAGNMFHRLGTHSQVADHNAQWALQTLDALGVRVMVLDLGGTVYRKLSWTVGLGDPDVTSMPA